MMIEISRSDLQKIIRLLDHSQRIIGYRTKDYKEAETARKSRLMIKKLNRKAV